MGNVYMWWLIAGAVLLIAEIFTPGFFLASIGLAAILTGVFSIFVRQPVLYWVFFIFANLMVFTFIRRIAVRAFYGGKNVKTNVYSLLGKECVVSEDVSGIDGGYVKIYGDSWKAYSADGAGIPKGEKVIIKESKGNSVIIKKIDERG